MESGSYWLDKVRISIWRDVRTLAIEEAYTTKYSIHPGADTMLCGFRLTNRWLSMKKDIASCGSKYLAYSEVEVEYQGSSGLHDLGAEHLLVDIVLSVQEVGFGYFRGILSMTISGSGRGARVDVRTYLLGGAIDSSEANGIIRDPKLELVGFTPRRRIGFRMELVQGATPICEGSCRLTSLERQEVWNDCRSYKVRVGSNGNLLWEASVLLGRKKGCVMDTLKFMAMPFGLTNAPAVFMELMSRKQGFGSILEKGEGDCLIVATIEGYYKDSMANVVRTSIWRDVRTLAIEEAYTTKYSIHPGADTMLCGFRLTNRWLSMKKDIASCGSKYLAYSEVEVEYQGSSGLLLQPELPE
ncbi:hypothetical protein Tco_0250378 [Tanacetum coccineum]